MPVLDTLIHTSITVIIDELLAHERAVCFFRFGALLVSFEFACLVAPFFDSLTVTIYGTLCPAYGLFFGGVRTLLVSFRIDSASRRAKQIGGALQCAGGLKGFRRRIRAGTSHSSVCAVRYGFR